MTSWIRRRVASDRVRLPLSAYDTVLRDTPARRAISPMFSAWASGLAGLDRLLRWAIRGPLRTSVIARMAAADHDNPTPWSHPPLQRIDSTLAITGSA